MVDQMNEQPVEETVEKESETVMQSEQPAADDTQNEYAESNTGAEMELSNNAAALAAAEPEVLETGSEGTVGSELAGTAEPQEEISVSGASLAAAEAGANDVASEEVTAPVVEENPPTTAEELRERAEEAAGIPAAEETGEAAAVTTPKSEGEADAAIEAAGLEVVKEGRSLAMVSVTEEGEVEPEGAPAVAEGGEAAEGEVEGAVAGTEGGEGDEGAEAEGERKTRRRRGKRGGKKGRSLSEFQPGEEVEGKVRSVQPYGAFVDVGAERDGLVHISELRDGFVEKVEDVVKEGDQITVRVKEVDAEKGRLSLTMRSQEAAAADQERAQRIRLRDLAEGQEFLGTITSIVDFGAFVDIGASTDGLVHISELSDERVSRVNDVVSEGQEVKVRVLTVDRKRNRISLTMREQVAPEEFAYEEEETGELPSAMELAFQRARERSKKDRDETTRQGSKRATNDRAVEDIIARTLEQHGS